MSAVLIVLFIVSLLILFLSMIFSSMSAGQADKNNTAKAKKYATWSALTSGVSIVLIIVLLAVYLHRESIMSSMSAMANKAAGYTQPYLNTLNA